LESKTNLVISENAENDLEEILSYYKHNPKYIENFLATYYSKLESLQLFPRLCPEYQIKSQEKYRVCFIKFFKIYYTIEENNIIVHHIIHTSRDETKLM
jgi:plasmid stabilization system protein ParE